MVWQDIVITLSIILMGYALVPQVYHGFVSKKMTVVFQTAFLTFVGMFVLTIVYFSLGLFFSGIISLFMTALWYILLLQNVLYK